MRSGRIGSAFLPARLPNAEGKGGVAARAIPERIGEPSLIEHVVYIIKENRTYDQVLGDLPQGRGRKVRKAAAISDFRRGSPAVR